MATFDLESYAAIRLSNGGVAVVSREDLPLVVGHTWHRRDDREGLSYAATNIRKPGGGYRYVRMHRLLTGAPPRTPVDHADGCGLNNRRENLRVCTLTENVRNSRARGGTSAFKGVSWHRATGKWQAQIHTPEGNLYLGVHDTEEDAATAYDAAAIQHYGEFARLNFPERQVA